MNDLKNSYPICLHSPAHPQHINNAFTVRFKLNWVKIHTVGKLIAWRSAVASASSLQLTLGLDHS
jgi:hypothetical protein